MSDIVATEEPSSLKGNNIGDDNKDVSVGDGNEMNVTTLDKPSSKKLKLDDNIKDTACVPTGEDNVTNIETNDPILSKRQQKKLIKLEQWEVKKKEKRLKEREKQKQKKLYALANGLPTRTGPNRKELKRMAEKSTNFLQVAVDLDYDDLMIDKDICKCVKQLLRMYTINRRSHMPANLHFTGIKENGRIHKTLQRNDGYQNWDVHYHFESYINVLDKSKIIYLTSDSDNILTELDKDVAYVIGGLVDHNHHKGLCYERAQKLELRTARLPLNEHVDLKTRSVLSTYHVFEILLQVSEGKSWTDAILSSLPKRKGAKVKKATVDNESDNS